MEALRDSSLGNSTNVIRKGSINLTPSLNRDISNLSFFDANYHFIYKVQPSGDVHIIVNPETKSLLDYDQTFVDPNIWVQVDAYGRALYSTVLADLGHSSCPNVLSSDLLLRQYTQNFTSNGIGANTKPGSATASYEDLEVQTGPLSITPCTMYQQYTCEVPKRRSTGSSIIVVLLADLVFLQTPMEAFHTCGDVARRQERRQSIVL